jgi:hypothetical protein
MTQKQENIVTLKDALQKPCRNRDMKLALTPMDNYKNRTQ